MRLRWAAEFLKFGSRNHLDREFELIGSVDDVSDAGVEMVISSLNDILY